tara:strand:+ start:198 stop:653 length:456 start_codon:yes stop_codon:yes gene_type:complete
MSEPSAPIFGPVSYLGDPKHVRRFLGLPFSSERGSGVVLNVGDHFNLHGVSKGFRDSGVFKEGHGQKRGFEFLAKEQRAAEDEARAMRMKAIRYRKGEGKQFASIADKIKNSSRLNIADAKAADISSRRSEMIGNRRRPPLDPDVFRRMHY